MSDRPPLSDRLFRLLLRLYPRSYRARYQVEMEAFFRQEREAVGGGAVFWTRVVLDHVEAAWAVRSRDGEREEGRMGRMMEEAKAAARTLRRAPRFTLFAVVTLALGVGSVSAVYAVVDRVVIRPLPYPGSERMVVMGIEPRHDPGSVGPLSPALYEALRAGPGPAEAVVASRTVEAVLSGEGDPERIQVNEVSSGFFETLGARPSVGRLLRVSDYEGGGDAVVVLGAGTWRDRYGGDPAIVGRAVRLDDRLHTVVGVIDDDFHTPAELVESRDYWVPLDVDPTIRGSFFLAGLARLRPGAEASDLDAHADAVFAEVFEDTGVPDFVLGVSVKGYRDVVVGPLGRNLGRILAAVFLLFMIACVNVAGLLLTRGAERGHELGLHFALGAGRGRLIRKLLLESSMLAVMGGAVGSLLAMGSVELFRSLGPAELPRLAEVAVDVRVLLFAVALAVGAVAVFGVLPALDSTRRLSGGSGSLRGAAGGAPSQTRLRSLLVAGETALAVVLVVGSALVAHDLARISREDPGFRPEGLVAMTLNLEPRYQRGEWIPVWRRIMEQARALPEVTAVAVATQAPWDGSRIASTYRPEGWEEEEPVFASTVGVGGAYVETLGTELLAGRELAPSDGDGEPVALVNEAFVQRFWPGESGVGKLVRSGQPDEPVYRVVGVLADVLTRPGRPVSPHVFLPLGAAPWREMDVLVRSSGGGVAAGLRAVVRRVDPALPVSHIQTMHELSSASLSAPRFYAGLLGGFALVSLVLALVGVYATTAHATRSRTREVGIRLALGARRSQVVAAVVTRSGMAVGLGVVVGLAFAALGAGLLSEVLLRVGPRNWETYLVVGTFVALAGIVSAWIPASAAGRADPTDALREETTR